MISSNFSYNEIYYNNVLKRYELSRKKWENSGYLDGLSDLQAKKTAQLLENQKTCLENNDNVCVNSYAKDVILSAVAKICKNSFEDNIVDIQPMVSPYGKAFYIDNTSIQENRDNIISIQARARKLKTKNPLFNETINLSILPEVMLANSIYIEQRMEIFCDLKINSSTIKCRTNEVKQQIEFFTSKFDEKDDKFIITSPEVAQFLEFPFKEDSNIKIITEVFCPTNVILLGCKKGYIYCPYMPIALPYDISSCGRNTILTRYAKRIFDKNLYTTIKITDIKI